MEHLVKQYIDSQVGWSFGTKETNLYNLKKICSLLNNRQENLNGVTLFKRMKAKGYKLYTIKVYMGIAKKFEKAMFSSQNIELFLKTHSYVFRNAYQDKTVMVDLRKFNEALQKAPNNGIYNALILMGRGGLRRSEMFNAKWSDFIDDNTLSVLGKGEKLRKVPFSKNWLRQTSTEKIVDIGSVVATYRYLKAYGFSHHDLRAFYATSVANTPGLNIKDAALVLGHSSITTTQRYVRSDYNRVSGILLEKKL